MTKPIDFLKCSIHRPGLGSRFSSCGNAASTACGAAMPAPISTIASAPTAGDWPCAQENAPRRNAKLHGVASTAIIRPMASEDTCPPRGTAASRPATRAGTVTL